jgi:hypothetical protein
VLSNPPDLFEVFVGSEAELVGARQIRGRFGVRVRVRVLKPFARQSFAANLLFEQRVHHDRGGAGVGDALNEHEVVDQRRCAGDEWVSEVQTEIVRREVHGVLLSSSAPRGSGGCGGFRREALQRAPTLADLVLGLFEHRFEVRGVVLFDHAEARFVAHVRGQRTGRLAAVELQGGFTERGATRIEAVERPCARRDRKFLLVGAEHQVVAVRDARL